MATRTKQSSKAADVVLTALRGLVKADHRSPADLRETARAIVDLRATFTYQGMKDWTGRSPEYRDLIQRLYRDAGVLPDSEDSLLGTIRYHLGNVLREVAPQEELAALGVSIKTPSERKVAQTKAARAEARKSPANVRRLPTADSSPIADDDIALLVSSASSSIRMLASPMIARRSGEDAVREALQQIAYEALDAARRVG